MGNVDSSVDRAQLKFTTQGEHLEKLRSLFRSERLSPFMGFLAVTTIALAKVTNHPRVSIVIPVAGHRHGIAVDITPGASLRDILRQVRRAVLDAHGRASEQSTDGAFFFDLEVEPEPADSATGSAPQLLSPEKLVTAEFDVFASVTPAVVRWQLGYAPSVFNRVTVEQFAGHVGLTSERFADRPDAPAGTRGDVPATRERTLATLYGEILGVGPVGLNENFFLLGGNSLLAIRLVNAVRARLGVELPLRAVFEAASPVELVTRLDEGAPVRAPLTRRARD